MVDEDFFDSLLNQFNEFIDVMLSDNDLRKRCLLIGKTDKKFYLVVSGLSDFCGDNDTQTNVKKIIDGFIEDIRKLVKIFYPLMNSNDCIEYVYASDNILFRNIVINDVAGKCVSFDTYGANKENKSRRRDFSCVERKLLAKFNNSVTALTKFDFLICRYKPCRMCYWTVQSLSNLYCFEDDKIYRIFIPENVFFPNYLLTAEQQLVLFLEGKHAENKNHLCLGENYVFVKEEI